MNRWTVLVAISAFLVLLALGCSGNSTVPVSPDAGNNLTAGLQHQAMGDTVLWGYYDVTIDIDTKTVEAVPNRSVQFAANVVQFLNNNPLGLAFAINDTPLGSNYVDVDINVSLTHPLSGLTQYNGYDVRGVFIGDGSKTMKYNTDLKYANLGTDQFMLADPDDGLGGPDGYTRWFNPKEFTTPGLFGYTPGKFATPAYNATATLNAYKYFADGLGATDSLWNFLNTTAGNGVFASGATNTRNYYLRFPNAKGIKYSYAVLADWSGEAPENHPSNAPESVGVSTSVTENLYYVDNTTKGGNLIADIDVFSWAAQPDKIFIESTVLNTVHQLDAGEMTPTGGTDTYSTYHVDIPGDHITGTTGQEFWVVCQYDTHNYNNTFGVPNIAGNDKLAALFRFPLPVSDTPSCFPVTVTGTDTTNMSAQAYTGVEITGTGFSGTGAGTTATVTYTGPDGDFVATNVSVSDDNTLTCDIDLSTATTDGSYDITVENECGMTGTGVGLVTFVACPPQIYYTSFAASEGESANWSNSGGGYWACLWFNGEICDSNAGCNTYGTPHFYAWRTNGITIPSCWVGGFELTIVDNCSKQESYYDRSGVQYSLNGTTWLTLNFYDRPYVYTGYWDYSWSSRTSHATLNTLVSPGGTIWIRFDSYSLDGIGNSASGWHITEMYID